MAAHEGSSSIPDVHIVARTNGVGMDRDVRILQHALQEFSVPSRFSRYRSVSPLYGVVGRRTPNVTLIFLERITARWLRSAEQFILVPNQERFARRHVPLLRRMDHIFCKTVHAQEIFSEHHPSCHYLGFTSVDRRADSVVPDYRRFFHLAGGSGVKGTALLLDLWRRHPEWPLLTIVWHRKGADTGIVPVNVELIDRYLEDGELQRLQGGCGIHLCPSLSEGWGHYIVEAMSCGAVAVVTDGAPMNELVNATRGVLVRASRTEPRKLGTDYHIDAAALEQAVSALVAMAIDEKAALGAAARLWYEQNDAAFRVKLRELYSKFISPG